MSERRGIPQLLRDAADLVEAGDVTPAAAAAALLPQPPVQTTPPRSWSGPSASTSRTSAESEIRLPCFGKKLHALFPGLCAVCMRLRQH